MKQSLLCTLIWEMVAHGYCFANFTISHDSLSEFFFTYWQLIWKSNLGRIFVYPYCILFRSIATMPWLNGMLTLLYAALSVYLVLRMFSIKRKTVAFFIAGIFITNLAVISTAATYMNDLDIDMLALLCATLATYLWWRWPKRGFLFGILLLAVSLGLYQSYISVAIVLIEFVCIVWLLNGQNAKPVLLSGLKGIAMLLSAGGLYLLLLKVNESIFHVGIMNGTPHSVSNLWTQSLSQKLSYIPKAYADWLTLFTRPVSVLPATIVMIANILLFVITLIMLISAIRRRKMPFTELLMTVALLILVPISSNICYVLNVGASSHLMEFAVWLFYLIPLLFDNLDAFRDVGEKLAERMSFIRVVSFILIAVFLWSNVLTANNAYIKKDMERQATLSSMTRAMSDLNNQLDYVWNETPVAFYGFDTEFETLPGFEDVRQVYGMDNNSQITLDYHFVYIRYILNEDIALCDASQYQMIKATEAFAQMPHFPEKGYIQMIDGVMAVKMGV